MCRCKADDVLAYSTPRISVIKDWRIGLLYYVLVVSVFAYVLGANVLYYKNYLDRRLPVGLTRLTIEPPPHFRNISAADLPYCHAYTGSHPAMDRMACNFVTDNDPVFTVPLSNALFIPTRVTEQRESTPCNRSSFTQECDYHADAVYNFFVTAIEQFTVRIYASVTDPSGNLKKAINTRDITGTFRGCDGELVPLDDGQYDQFPVGDLLKYACAEDLDTLSDADNPYPQSQRTAGLVLLVSLEFDNSRTFNPGVVDYTYSARILKRAKFKSVGTTATMDFKQRVTSNRHGIMVALKVAGALGSFSFANLLVQLTSSLGLLAVASFVVDQTMMKLLRNSGEYFALKNKESASFGASFGSLGGLGDVTNEVTRYHPVVNQRQAGEPHDNA